MGDLWTGWERPTEEDPYIDWWMRVEKPLSQRNGVEFGSVPILERVDFSFRRFFHAETFFAASKGIDITAIDNPAHRRLSRKTKAPLPIPTFAKRKGDDDDNDNDNDNSYANLPPAKDLFGPDADGNGGLPDDTIIVGVIDTDIPLGHARFRDAEGKSRILAAWQMLAPWDGPNGLKQPFLPFGRELYKDRIDELLAEHSGGSLDGWLDEQAFNAATGVLDMRHPGGRRGIAGRASHGAHVLDLAAGADPLSDEDFAKRVKIIAINIPDSSNFGAPGTFLDEYLRYAILRVTDLADALWLRNHPHKQQKPFGYPVVLNISFGKQAGAKSNLDRLPAFISELRDVRQKDGSSNVYVVMPAGNDNDLQCNAFLEPDQDEPAELDWRILPEDRSSNFVEVWLEREARDPDADTPPAHISLVPPGGNDQDHPLDLGSPGMVKHLREPDRPNNIASIYCERIPRPEKRGSHYYRYVLCVAPTYIQFDQNAAQSGQWKIRLHNHTGERIQCRLSVQTDQQISAASPNNLRSYFDDQHYRRYDDTGRPVESECYPYDKTRTIKPDLCGGSPVRRHGTMNSSASNDTVARVGGYRLTDGRPASYSATGRGRPDGTDDGTLLGHRLVRGSSGAPTAALPTDDGPAHFGILAAGAANGSSVAMRGTSFASAQATRCVVRYLLDNEEAKKSTNKILWELAKHSEKTRYDDHFGKSYPGEADIDVAGGGRLRSPVKPRVDRMGCKS